MLEMLKTIIVAMLAVAVYHFREDLPLNLAEKRISKDALIRAKFGDYYTDDHPNLKHKPRKFFHEDYEEYFNVFVTHELITDESIKALVDANDIYQEEEYKKHKDYYDELADTYGLYLDKTGKNDRRIYVAFCGPQKGFGTFATVDLPKGAFLMEYTGILTNNSANTDYAWTYLSENIKDETGKNLELMIDGRIVGNVLRFVNHHDKPNVKAMEVPWKNRWHRIYVTTKSIPEGSELFVSYGDAYWKDRSGKVLD